MVKVLKVLERLLDYGNSTLSMSPQLSCLLTKADGSWTDSEKESLNLLLNSRFPCSEPVESTILADICSNAHIKHDVITDQIFSPEKLSWAINRFKPFKSAGIHSITIQKAQ